MLSKFNYIKPATLVEALAYLGQHATDTKVLAGGTDLLVALRRHQVQPAVILDIKGVKELLELTFTPGKGMLIGSAVTVNQLAAHPAVSTKYPALMQSANSLASYQLRNRATVGGNLCNASPAADLAPPLLLYDAEVRLVSQRGERAMPLQQFITGVKQTAIHQDEILTGIFLPDVDDISSLYLKQGRIKGHDLSIVSLAARLNGHKQMYFAMGAVAATPLRLTQLEKVLNAKTCAPTDLANLAEEEINNYISPISDVRASAEYRRHTARVLLRRAIQQLVAAGGEANG